MKIKIDDALKSMINANREVIKLDVENMSKASEDSTDPSVYYDINEKDTILVQIVKEIINERKINIKSLKFDDDRQLNNYKRSLLIHNTMSISKFEKWMDLMGEEWCLVYGDEYKEYEAWRKENSKKKINNLD